MTTDSVHPDPNLSVLIELLDPTFEKPVKSWSFVGRTSITIGRANDQDVEVSDVYVSRSHAKLSFCDNRWILVSLGRNGVLVENKQVTDYPLECGCKFRLGSGGPFLRMQTSGEQSEGTHTICFDTFPVSMFALDEANLQQEVTQIAGGNYFQTLQEKARELRLRRNST
ncbi:FHA domain-containing protein [Anatilimnocola aggregata]|nr:FHA domain-containing protein [Anatilimnocola aggregata]